MSDLAGFLAARLGEDEAVAIAAARSCENGFAGRAHWVPAYGTVVAADDPDYAIMTDTTSEIHEHIARWDPARVLREVEAKRKILAIHQPHLSDYGEPPCCSACWPEPKIGTHPLWPCSTLRALAAVYSDHPDYDPEWKAS